MAQIACPPAPSAAPTVATATPANFAGLTKTLTSAATPVMSNAEMDVCRPDLHAVMPMHTTATPMRRAMMMGGVCIVVISGRLVR